MSAQIVYEFAGDRFSIQSSTYKPKDLHLHYLREMKENPDFKYLKATKYGFLDFIVTDFARPSPMFGQHKSIFGRLKIEWYPN